MSLNSVSMMRNLTADTRRNLSPAVWGQFPIASILSKDVDGIFKYDDFSNLGLAPTLTTQIGWDGYKAFANTGCTISKISAVNSVELPGGTLEFALDTDNDSASLARAYPDLLISSGAGKIVFEACYAQASVATNMAATIFGLAEVEQWTLANAVPLNASDAITNAASFIGFKVEEDGLGVVDTCYSDRATSLTDIGAAEGGTLVAYTFKKFGMVIDLNTYDPDDAVRFYADNRLLATKMSRSSLAALTNLDANGLGPIFATCADSGGTAHRGYLKWWAWGQVYE
ncbi:MAG TPA: hypothetical protein VM529_24945 [Gemmata sp.]|jgi:hypothetical protein|nr:hypothetical protein [Gemmata sp.]